MQEALLHHIWKFNKFQATALRTTQNQDVVIKSLGQHNLNAGPDFFNAQIHIDGQLWAGNVEIHLKSSDWFVHNHEMDQNYDNVILHVVWEHDTDIYRKNNSAIPTLELKNYVDERFLANYQELFQNQNTWINCENQFPTISDFLLNNWLERLYFERLEEKSERIENLLTKSNNNWEAVLFCMLARNFGLKVNADAFFSMAKSIDFSVIRKLQSNPTQLEALFFGQAGLLELETQEPYQEMLRNSYNFLKQKFQLQNEQVMPVQFFRLRPQNFPTIRLSQLAMLYHKQSSLFSKVLSCKSLDDFYKLFKVSASEFWHTHYTFGTPSKKSKKTLTKSFINLLVINTLLPIKFCHAQKQGKDIQEELLQIINEIPSESNAIITKFQKLKDVSKSAQHSQALLQLKTTYCDKNRCLQCAVGNAVLTK